MAPPGKHYMTVYGQWAPYHLKEGTWDEIGDSYVKHCVDLMTEYIPNLPDIIDDYFLVSPKELEGPAIHEPGAHVPRRLRGRASYSSIDLSPAGPTTAHPSTTCTCAGAGTHPGGTVTGAPGHNAAHEILKDWKEGVVG